MTYVCRVFWSDMDTCSRRMNLTAQLKSSLPSGKPVTLMLVELLGFWFSSVEIETRADVFLFVCLFS